MSFNAHIQERFQDFEGASDFEISLIKYRVKFPDVDRLSEISGGISDPFLRSIMCSARCVHGRRLVLRALYSIYGSYTYLSRM